MLTGDASVNPDAPIICCTAEVLANIALREGATADVGLVVMDEFHFYSEHDRGWAWQVPLLELPSGAVPADVGDAGRRVAASSRTSTAAPAATTARRRRRRASGAAELQLGDRAADETLEELVTTGQVPVYVVHFTQAAAVEHATNLAALDGRVVDGREQKDRDRRARSGPSGSAPASGARCRRLVRNGIGVHHAGMLPQLPPAGRAARPGRGCCTVICGTDTLGVGINVPIRTVLFTGLAKFDGTRQRVLRTREFQQIAGRAGPRRLRHQPATSSSRRPSTSSRTSGRRPSRRATARQEEVARCSCKKPPEGAVVWTEQTFDKLVAGVARAAGRRRMKVDNAMLVNVVAREEDAFPVMRRLLHATTTRSARKQLRLARRALRLARSLVRSGVADPARRGRRVRPPLRAHRRPARRLRAQPAAGALRAGRLRRARPRGADVHPRRGLGRRGRPGGAAPGAVRPAARRPRARRSRR